MKKGKLKRIGEDRTGNRNKHHLKPKCRKGKKGKHNLLLIHQGRHRGWHRCFGNRTLDEVIDLLERIKRAKEHQRGE